MGPRMSSAMTNVAATVAKMMAARPRLPSSKCPEPGISQARITTRIGERAGAELLTAAEDAGITLILAAAQAANAWRDAQAGLQWSGPPPADVAELADALDSGS